jgi:hypothetical protein
MHQVRPEPVQTPAPALAVVRTETPAARAVTPNTEDGLDATLQHTPAARSPTRPNPAPQPTLKEAPAPVIAHLDATLDLTQPRVTKGAAPSKAERSLALPVAIVLAAVVLAVGAWFALAGKSMPTPPASPPAALVVPAPPETPAAPAVPRAKAAELLAADATDAAVADLAPAVRACHPAGALEASVLLDGKGHATDVQFRRNSADAAVAGCVTAALRKYRFAESSAPLRQALLLFPVESAPPTAAAAPASIEAAPKVAPKAHRAPKPSPSKPNGDEAL